MKGYPFGVTEVEILAEIKKTFILNDIKGVKQSAYDKISNSLGIQGQYRTYDYMIAKKSSVYLEPIRVFTDED